MPDKYTSETEKLIEQKMDEIQDSVKKIDNEQQVDLSSIPADLSKLEKEIQFEKKKKVSAEKSAVTQFKSKESPATASFKPELKDILPLWIEKPFYYITPSDKFQDRRKLWQKEWADFLLQWASFKEEYVVEILALQKEYPFKNPVINKELSNDQLQLIGDYLIENNNGEWKTKSKSHIRVIWEPLETTADKIYQWAFNHGQKYVGIYDILDSKQVFAELSNDEIQECLVLLVKNKKGEWADKKK